MTSVDSKSQSAVEGQPGPQLLPMIAKAVKLSQELPTVNTPAYIYYNDFPQYKAIAAGQSKKILSIVQNVLDLLDARTNVLDIPNSKSSREKFSSIVDANDRLLERLSMAMDMEEDPGRRATAQRVSENLVVAVHKNQSTSIGWLKAGTKILGSDQTEQQESTAGDGLLKLLTSTTIRRPQTLFSVPPDNSPAPFRPNLSHKPNQIRSLSDSLPSELEGDTEYPHPYEAELDAFAHTISHWKPLNPEAHPLEPIDANYKFVDTLSALDAALSEISMHKEVAVDLEHHSHRSYLGITCLVQLSTRTTDYILDALALRDHLYKLNVIFTDPDVVKVFHGSDMDLMWLQRDFSVYVINLFDTGLAARALQLGRFSLSFLLLRYANFRANKKYQLADWRIRPLPDELIEYARADTHYLLHVSAVMCQELQDRGLLEVVLEGGRQLCLKRYTKPAFDPLGYLSLYRQAAGTSFNHRQLYALEQLYALRDSIARREDESVHYVLPNHMLKTIAEVLPRESSGLFACCNPIPPLVRKYVHDLHKIIVDARNKPISELTITPLPDTNVPINTPDHVDPQPSAPGSMVYSTFVPAPPHDQSHGFQPSSKVAVTTAKDLETGPSPLGRIFGDENTQHMDDTSEITCQKWWASRLMDPNRLLLNELLRLLSIGLTEGSKTFSSEMTYTKDTIVQPAASAPRQTPAEPIIKLELDDKPNETNRPIVPSKQKGFLAGKPQVLTDPDSSTTAAAPNFNSDEVVILRQEMPSRNKRSGRQRKRKQPADHSFVQDVSGANEISDSGTASENFTETHVAMRGMASQRSKMSRKPRNTAQTRRTHGNIHHQGRKS